MDKSRRSKGMILGGLKGQNWTVQRDETGRSQAMKLDGIEGFELGLG